jgi:hypothetical protein
MPKKCLSVNNGLCIHQAVIFYRLDIQTKNQRGPSSPINPFSIVLGDIAVNLLATHYTHTRTNTSITMLITVRVYLQR